MDFEILGNPDYGDLTVFLEPGESVYGEGGAMSRMSPDLEVRGRMLGGVVRSLVRKAFGGESAFLAEYTARGKGFVAMSPSLPGTVAPRELRGESFLLTAGSFLACTPGIDVRTRFGGLRSLFSGEGAFLIECRGTGTVFFNTYGAMIKREVQGSLTVDTGHVVAWEPTLGYTIRGMGGMKQTFFSGEGLVMAFEGTGTIYLQTRHVGGMVRWLSPFCST